MSSFVAIMHNRHAQNLDLAQARPLLPSQRERSLLVARGFLFLGQLVVPNIVAQTQFRRQRFGFANTDLAALVQELLNKSVIGVFFGEMFHREMVAERVEAGNGSSAELAVTPAACADPHHDGLASGFTMPQAHPASQ